MSESFNLKALYKLFLVQRKHHPSELWYGIPHPRLEFLQAHSMRRDSGAGSPSPYSLFLEVRATLRFHLYTLLSFEKILRMTAEKYAVDSDFLALVKHSLNRLIDAESDVTPVQARELFVVVGIILTLKHSGEVLYLAFPFKGPDALDEAWAACNEGLHEVLH